MLEWIITLIMAPLRGEEPFWLVFWVYVVLVGIVTSLLQIVVMFHPLPFPASWDNSLNHLGIGFGYVYDIWVDIALWQCAFNGTSKVTGYITRCGVVLGVLFSIISLFFSSVGTDFIPKDATTQAQTEQLTKILEMLKH